MLITLRGGPSRSNEHELATPRCRWPASESVLRFHRPPFEFSWIRNPSRLSRVSLKRWNVYIATWIVYILCLCLSFSLCSPFSLVFQASFLFFFVFIPPFLSCLSSTLFVQITRRCSEEDKEDTWLDKDILLFFKGHCHYSRTRVSFDVSLGIFLTPRVIIARWYTEGVISIIVNRCFSLNNRPLFTKG